MDEQWWGFNNAAWVFIIISCTTFTITATLLNYQPPYSQHLDCYHQYLMLSIKEIKVNPPTLSMAQQHATPQVKISLGGTIRNHLKEWKGNKKQPIHFLGPFILNVFTTIKFFFSCLSITCTNIWLEVYFVINS
jgi:hypothetical protein